MTNTTDGSPQPDPSYGRTDEPISSGGKAMTDQLIQQLRADFFQSEEYAKRGENGYTSFLQDRHIALLQKSVTFTQTEKDLRNELAGMQDRLEDMDELCKETIQMYGSEVYLGRVARGVSDADAIVQSQQCESELNSRREAIMSPKEGQ